MMHLLRPCDRLASVHGFRAAAKSTAESMRASLHELDGHAAEGTEIGVQGVTLFRPHRSDERSGEHDIAWLEHAAKGSELIGKPGDAKRRMSEHAGGDTGLLDF